MIDIKSSFILMISFMFVMTSNRFEASGNSAKSSQSVSSLETCSVGYSNHSNGNMSDYGVVDIVKDINSLDLSDFIPSDINNPLDELEEVIINIPDINNSGFAIDAQYLENTNSKNTVINNSNSIDNNQADDHIAIDINNIDHGKDISFDRYKWLIDIKDKDIVRFNRELYLKNMKTRKRNREFKISKDINGFFLERLNLAEEEENVIEILKVFLEVVLSKDNNKVNQLNRNSIINLITNASGTALGVSVIIVLNWVLNNWAKA